MDKKALRRELLNTAFIQFAENQRSKEQTFLKILGFLGTVFFGFVGSYYYFEQGTIRLSAFSLVYIISSFLLFCGAWVIVILGYSYRRDQFIKDRIRRIAEIDIEVYPKNYNPFNIYRYKKSKNIFNVFMEKNVRDYYKAIKLYNGALSNNIINFIFIRWLPDLFIVYYCLFPFFLSIQVYWYTIRLIFVESVIPFNFLTTIISLVSISFFILVLYLPIHYSRKLMRRLSIWSNFIPGGLLSNKDPDKTDKILDRLSSLIKKNETIDIVEINKELYNQK